MATSMHLQGSVADAQPWGNQAAKLGVAGATAEDTAVNLYWLPLGAGGHFVRFNGRVFEAAMALIQHRPIYDLYHSALEVSLPDGRFVIEQTPVPDNRGAARGVVAGGAVGSRWAGHLRIFRYEVRRWRDGVIPDAAEAVESPVLLSADRACAQRVLDLAPLVPALVWGRDQVAAGEMWNSNSIISWILERSGLDAASIHPPADGRAPGWQAGLIVARRQRARACPADHPLERASQVHADSLPASFESRAAGQYGVPNPAKFRF